LILGPLGRQHGQTTFVEPSEVDNIIREVTDRKGFAGTPVEHHQQRLRFLIRTHEREPTTGG